MSISIKDDSLEEESETFKLNLKNPDSEEVLSQHEITILDDDSNQAPVVDAGPNIEQNSGASFVISSAVVSDPEGDTLTYLWEQISGTSVSIANSDTLELSVSIPQNFAAGDIEFKLTVTDEKGASASDSLVVKVINQPELPTPNEPEQTKSGGGFTYILALLLLLILNRRKHLL